MKKIITVSRELGSGGRTIGKQVAEKMGIPLIDREIIDEAAKASGFSADFIGKTEQRMTNSLLYNIAMGTGYGINIMAGNMHENLSLNAQVYLAQQKVIKKYAENSCVIVGRCADYILKDLDSVLRCFVYSDVESRVKRAVTEYGMDMGTAREEIHRSDKRRANHYNVFTDQKWGDRRNYDLMINSGRLGIELASEMIVKAAEEAG